MRRIFPKDVEFYSSFFHLLIVVAFQNVVAYSVNVADNLMLGTYSQAALSGAATVNQLQFIVQQLTISIGDSMIMLNSQYWGKKELSPARSVTGTAMKVGFGFGLLMLILTTVFPGQLLHLFTNDAEIVAAGVEYLGLMRFTYVFYILTTIMIASLRSVQTVNVAFGVSVMSLIVNVGINYTLIFGRFGMPEMGIRGASVGTLTSRILEFLVVLFYLVRKDKKLCLFSENPFRRNRELAADYRNVLMPTLINSILWALITPIQTGILGHLSSDAIAANSVSMTMFQYLKFVIVSAASATGVMIGRMIGSGKNNKEQLRPYVNTLQVIYLALGVMLGLVLVLIRNPLLSLYSLTPEALRLAKQLLALMAVVFVGMAYQMPTSVGIIRGGGDAKFNLYLNLISTWLILMPLSFAAAFWWKLPIVWVVLCLNSDQLFKCIPVAWFSNSYRWIRILTRKSESVKE